MAHLYKANGEILKVSPNNGKKFELEEVQKMVGGYVEMHNMNNNQILLCNEDGIPTGLEYNANATTYAFLKGGFRANLFGDILFCGKGEF